MALQEILTLMPNLHPGDRLLIESAYHFGEMAHANQYRKSGEPYYIHCEAVAVILAEWKLDATAVAAGLLHDVAEDTDYVIHDLEERFGDEVAILVDGVTKMERVTRLNSQGAKPTEAEYLRRTLNSMSNDVRVILIKLADRLHNMRTLGSLSPGRRYAIAEETMQLFAPLANRLGMWRVKAELEDLAFRYLEPEAYRVIATKVNKRQVEREAFIQSISQQLHSELKKQGITATIQGRPKHFYSIHRKMQQKGISFEETYDVRGIRVIVEEVLDCYTVLGVVHSLWKPIAGQFDDYIGAPKDNFYQSLHTAVFCGDDESGATFEVQIRTRKMHDASEFGIAAHWRYKSSGESEGDREVARRIDYMRSLIQPAEVEEDADDFMKVLIETIHNDRVFAFTPKGDVIDLPLGATCIDFAYYIHTDVGHRCRGARVNNQLRPLEYQIQSGDRVEIMTATRGGPSPEWLDPSLRYVKTPRARNKIREWFRKQKRTRMIESGRDTLVQRLWQLGVDDLPYESLLAHTPHGSIDEMLEAIGRGMTSATEAISHELERQDYRQAASASGHSIPMIGANGYDVRLARCCNPQLGDTIVGYITQKGGVTVHRTDCYNVRALVAAGSDQITPVQWGQRPRSAVFLAPVEIIAEDRAGLMGEIGAVVAQENINMTDVRIHTKDGQAIFHVVMEVDSYATLIRVLTHIQSLQSAIAARRYVPATPKG